MKLPRQSKYLKNPYVVFFAAIASLAIAITIIFRLLDVDAFKDAVRQAGNEPLGVCIALGAFMLAFLLRLSLIHI